MHINSGIEFSTLGKVNTLEELSPVFKPQATVDLNLHL